MGRRNGRRWAAWVLTVLLALACGCMQVQEAAGCNTPGLFGCRDEPPPPPAGERPPTPVEDAEDGRDDA